MPVVISHRTKARVSKYSVLQAKMCTVPHSTVLYTTLMVQLQVMNAKEKPVQCLFEASRLTFS